MLRNRIPTWENGLYFLKPSDTEYPVFGKIQHMIIVEDFKYLAAQHISLTTTTLHTKCAQLTLST